MEKREWPEDNKGLCLYNRRCGRRNVGPVGVVAFWTKIDDNLKIYFACLLRNESTFDASHLFVANTFFPRVRRRRKTLWCYDVT